MNSNQILWTTTIVMLVGGLVILARGKRRTSSEGLQTALHGIVPIIAACLYFAMATGQGSVLLPIGLPNSDVVVGTRTFYFARYIDWTFTTPLLLVSLWMTAVHAGQKRAGLVVGVVLADVMMIVTAFAFGASIVPWVKWTWFVISCAAFVAVYFVIWVSQKEANRLERDDVQATYRRNASMLSVLWLIYPLILAVSPDGLNVLADAPSVLAIAILDVLAKVVYGLIAVTADGKATERDLIESGVAKRTVAA